MIDTAAAVGRRWNAGVMSSVRTDWSTPRQLFEMLDREFHFTLDACATSKNLPRPGIEHIDPSISNALIRPWVPLEQGAVWCNPPYGKELPWWIYKAHAENAMHFLTVVMLLPARTDTKWFHQYCLDRAEIRFLQGRLSFDDNRRKRAPFPSMLLIFRGRA